jgi:uncharacterized protein YuzE
MKISYYKDTDTLYLEFKDTSIEETKELDENTYLELDAQGNLVAITLEHASSRADLNQVYLSGIAA